MLLKFDSQIYRNLRMSRILLRRAFAKHQNTPNLRDKMNSCNAFFSGFSLGLLLILAIGVQNAFVLKQGIKKQHVFLVCIICALSDAALIFAGVSGFGYVVERYPIIKTAALCGGFVFLSIYGIRSLYSAFSASHALTAGGEEARQCGKNGASYASFYVAKPARLS